MNTTTLRAFAAEGPVPLFVAVGQGMQVAAEAVCVSSSIARAASPRHASVLLVAGDVRPADREALWRLHDQMPHPRATLWWGGVASDRIDGATLLAADEDPLPLLRSLYRRLLQGELASEVHLLPDEPPVPWRGLGEHGQGGKGMMGGTPYGRPMAMTADELRDGLKLDAYTVEIGPFLPTLPPGLVLQITLQGDVVQQAKVVRPPYPLGCMWSAEDAGPRKGATDVHKGAADVPFHEHPAARCLSCIAGVLTLQQLLPQAERCRRVAMSLRQGEATRLPDVRRMLRHTGALAAIPPELGRIDPSLALALGGIGLTVRDRVRQWQGEVDRAVQVVDTIGLAQADATLSPTQARAGAGAGAGAGAQASEHELDALACLPSSFTDLLTGLEWGEALLVIASFDIPALARMSPGADEAPVPDHSSKHAMEHGS